jgi:hypothetical protein
MGFIYDLFHELDNIDIATEAIEDITEEVSANTDAMMGRDTGASTTARKSSFDNNEGELDPSTDNILGSSEDEDDDTFGSNTNPDDEKEDGNPEDDMLEDESLDNPEDSENPDDLGGEIPEKKDPVDLYRKKKLHAQYVTLFETLETDINLVSEFIPRISNGSTLHILSNVNNNLTQCKEYAESILIEEFDKLEYHTLLKKYVALNRVYDLCIKILEKYFDFKRENK